MLLKKAKPVKTRAVSFTEEKTPAAQSDINNSKGKWTKVTSTKATAVQPANNDSKKQTITVTKTAKANKDVKTVRFSDESLPNSPVKKVKKEVRFSNMVEERTVPGEDASDEGSEMSSSSSDSSCDSYIDAPSPTEQYDVFPADYSARGTPETYRHSGSGARLIRSDSPARSGGSGSRSSFNSGEGSFIDVDEDIPLFRVSRRPRRSSLANCQGGDDEVAEHLTHSDTDFESNVDYDPGASRFHRQQALSPLSAPRRHLPSRRKPPPKPITVVPSRLESATRGKWEPERDLRRGKDNGDSLRTEYHKESPSKGGKKRSKKGTYEPPHVSDEEENDNPIQIDPVTRIDFRDV